MSQRAIVFEGFVVRRRRVGAALAVVGILLPVVCGSHAFAVETRAAQMQTLVEALRAFDRGAESVRTSPGDAVDAFRQAAAGFESLISDGVRNGKLYYDLGNAYLQLGDIGRAILNYRRAERLIGNDAQLQANLRYARSLCRNRIERSGEKQLLRTAFFWHYDTPIAVRYYVAIVAYVVFWIILLLRAVFRWRSGSSIAAAVMLVVWLSAGISVAVETVQAHSVRYGVTIQSDITVRKGNGEGYDPQFKENLHEGVEFRLLEERFGWYKIELPDGNTGWLRDRQAELV